MEIKKINAYLLNKMGNFIKTSILIYVIFLSVQESKLIVKDLLLPCKIGNVKSAERVKVETSLSFLGYKNLKSDIVDGLIVGAKRLREYPVSSKVIKEPSKLVTALAHTESEMSITAKSKLGYSGIMQTPPKETTRKYADVDILHGCRILEEKLQDPKSKGDLRIALAMYKGGLNPLAFKQADQVLSLYEKLKSLPA